MKRLPPLLLLVILLFSAGCRETQPAPFRVKVLQRGHWHSPDENGFYNLKKDTFALIFYFRDVRTRNDTSITLDYMATFNPANFAKYDTAKRLYNLVDGEFGGRNTNVRNRSQNLTMDMKGGYSSLEFNKQFHSYTGLRYTPAGVEGTYYVGQVFDCNTEKDVPIAQLPANELRVRFAVSDGRLGEERLPKLLKIRFR